jgi:hypothetical protein
MTMAEDENPYEILGAAVDAYFGYLKSTISSLPSGGTELGQQMKTFAERSVTTTHELVKYCTQVKAFRDMIGMQNEFMQTQMKALRELVKGPMVSAPANEGDAKLPAHRDSKGRVA